MQGKRSFSVHGSLRAGAAWKLFVYTDFPPARGCTEARFPLITCRFATCVKSREADFLTAAFPAHIGNKYGAGATQCPVDNFF